MKITPFVLTVRAVGAEFAQRILLPIVTIVGSVLLLLIAAAVWLVILSEWWWFLLAPLIFLTLLFIFASVMTGVIIRLLKPIQTKTQRTQVKSFVDALQETSDAIQTPKIILLARVIKDVIFPTKESYINKLSSSALSLTTRFKALVTTFTRSS